MENKTDQPNTTNTPADIQECLRFTLALYYDLGMPIYAMVATIIITFFEKRRCKAEFCHGRPGLPLPTNFLDGTTNSIANAAAFGCTLEHIMYYVFIGPIKWTNERWLFSLQLLLTCFLMSLVFYPIFACLNSPSRLFGSTIGFFYTLLLTLVVFNQNYLCNQGAWEWAFYVVVLICETYLLVLFIYRTVTSLSKKSVNCKEPLVKVDQLLHVRDLVRKPKNSSEENRIKKKIIKYAHGILDEAKLCCLHKSLYRCTTRTVAINTIVLLVFYYAFLLTIIVSKNLGQLYDDLSSKEYILLDSIKISEKVRRYLQTGTQVIRVSLIIANVLSAVYLIANMVLIYRSQRQHIIQIWRGDRSFIPRNCIQTHGDMVMKSLMYAGNQVSHLLGGYIISQTVVFLFCVLLAYCVVLPIMKEVPVSFLSPLEALLPGVVFMFIFRVVLRIISRKAFLQNHYISSDNGEHWEKVLALDNRRVYQNLSYFLFFYYILIGLFRCLYRVMMSMCLGLFYIARMDRSVLFPGYEHLDISYMTYLGFLEVELHHCHPVVVVFCDQMIKAVKLSSSSSSKKHNSLQNAHESSEYDFSQGYTAKVRNKWQKMKTLICNQTLCKDSKSNCSFEHPLHAKKTVVESSIITPPDKV
ncbi:stimulated by retinoic acid gene 6 protein-like [Saccostrea echinata]|uniref:stimulated by retinoic acid gene 6 protein-like n=1 Tax=Saccostrea echinata TaxID=191078 RepID=UPI002A7EB775|nr:stimulated by retinoic acid gene 6 protein-like [Saccostrea echinata]